MKRVFLHTLGCKLNATETATIARQFTERGFSVVNGSGRFDIFVLNTCSVTERADRECRQLVRRALRQSPHAYVVVAGCYAQLQPDTISDIGGVDLILGSSEKFHIFDYVSSFRKTGTAQRHVSDISSRMQVERSTSIGLAERTRSFLKIQDGCDYSCSFCTIPLARGGSRSVPLESIRDDARTIAEAGYKEVVLTGVNVADYGSKIDLDLLDVLQMLVQVDGIERIRISSVEPNLLTDELLDFWFSEQKICKHFHIPLQSGADEILNRMRRRYRRDRYENRIRRIADHVPFPGIGADVIVGFPGETDEHVVDTYEFLRELPITYLHVFSYSERPGTDAAGMEKPVERAERAARSDRLRQLSLRKRRLFHEHAIGRTLNVLFENRSADGILEGLSDEYIRVRTSGTADRVNQIHPVIVDKAEHELCEGTLQLDAPLAGISVSDRRIGP